MVITRGVLAKSPEPETRDENDWQYNNHKPRKSMEYRVRFNSGAGPPSGAPYRKLKETHKLIFS